MVGFSLNCELLFLWVFISNTALYLLSSFLPSMSDAAPEQHITLSWPPPKQADTQKSGHTASEARTGLLVTLLEVFVGARGPDAPANKRLLRHFTLQISSGMHHSVNVAPRNKKNDNWVLCHACKAL